MDTAWTEQFVNDGFVVCRGLVDPCWCDRAMDAVRGIMAIDRPLESWVDGDPVTTHQPFYAGATPPQPVLDTLFDQPRLAAAIDDLFGGAGKWNHERNYYLFLRAYNLNAEQCIAPRGHIDFPGVSVPVLFRGFTFQIALAATEPFSGNLTVHPGSHRAMQKLLIDHPDVDLPSGCSDIALEPPYEFVAGAGDVLFMHHLMVHSGNVSHAEGRSPRVGLHAEVFRDAWLPSIDPASPHLSPWERSLAHNGPVVADPAVEAAVQRKREDYLEKLRAETAATA